MLLKVDDQTDLSLKSRFKEYFPKYYVPVMMQKMVANDPTLSMLRDVVTLQEKKASLQKAAYYPTLAAFGSYSYGGEGDKASIGSESMDPFAVVGLSLNFTIWDGGAISSKHRQAILDRANAQLSLDQKERSLEHELKITIAEYDALIEIYRTGLKGLKLALRSFELTRDLYKSGNISLVQLNDSEKFLAEAKLGVSYTLFRINNLMSKIEKLTSKKG